MSNTKRFRIVAEVPFNYLSEAPDEGLSTADAAGLAALVLTPATQCVIVYANAGMRPNSRGGQTAMYRVTIEGTEALSAAFLARIARALGNCGEFAKLHVAELEDLDDGSAYGWEHFVPAGELSGEAV